MDWVQQITAWSGWLAGLLWGNPLTLAVLLGTGLYLTLRMGLVKKLKDDYFAAPQSRGTDA